MRCESGITSASVQAQEGELEYPPSDSSNIRRTKLRASSAMEKLTRRKAARAKRAPCLR